MTLARSNSTNEIKLCLFVTAKSAGPKRPRWQSLPPVHGWVGLRQPRHDFISARMTWYTTYVSAVLSRGTAMADAGWSSGRGGFARLFVNCERIGTN